MSVRERAVAGCAETDTQIRKVASLITAARRLLAEGKMVDLSALEGKVRELCAQVSAVPPADGTPVRRAMEGIVADLEGLAADIGDRHAEVAGLLDSGAPTPGEAARAYQKPQAKD